MDGSMVDHLVGSWRGSGAGTFGGEPFEFDEWIEFDPLGPRGLYYGLRAVSPDGDLFHTESGIWLVGDEKATITVALPRATEISEGEVDGHEIRLASTAVSVASTVTEPHLISTARWYSCDGTTLSYDVAIGLSGIPENRHVWAELSRESE